MHEYLSRLERLERQIDSIMSVQRAMEPRIQLRMCSIIENRYKLIFPNAEAIDCGFDEVINRLSYCPDAVVEVNMIYCDEWVHLFFYNRDKEECAPGVAERERDTDLENKTYLRILHNPEGSVLKSKIENMKYSFSFYGRDILG